MPIFQPPERAPTRRGISLSSLHSSRIQHVMRSAWGCAGMSEQGRGAGEGADGRGGTRRHGRKRADGRGGTGGSARTEAEARGRRRKRADGGGSARTEAGARGGRSSPCAGHPVFSQGGSLVGIGLGLRVGSIDAGGISCSSLLGVCSIRQPWLWSRRWCRRHRSTPLVRSVVPPVL
jgi:hypothetical protein